MWYKLTGIFVGSNQVRPVSVWDYATKNTSTSMSNSSNFYGVCIKAIKNCKITKIKFLGDQGTAGTLKLTVGTGLYYSDIQSEINYTLTASDTTWGFYTLPTPYVLTANSEYCIGFKRGGIWATYYRDNYMSTYPVQWTNITFQWGTNSTTASHNRTNCYYISWVQTE